MNIADINAFLGRYFSSVELVGSDQTEITGPAKIEEAVSGQVSFVSNEKYYRHIAQSGASLLIVHPKAPVDDAPEGMSFLKVEDPYTAFVFILRHFAGARRIAESGVAASASIAPSARLGRNVSVGEHAVIGERCVIGDNTVIGPNTVLLDEVTIGSECTLFPQVTMYDGTLIGDRVTIHSGTVIGADGFGFAPQKDGSYVKIPQMGTVRIEDDVEIGANTTIDRATMGETVIEKGVKIDNLVQIAHNCRIGGDTVIASQAGISGSVKIGRNCLIGGQAGFAGHLELADKISVAAKAGISKSFMQSGQAIRGVPAQPMRDQLRQEAQIRSLGEMKAKIEALETKLQELWERLDGLA
ncbi:UDP-3-O-(3-hydroxymyristoyl) glucosamine N-acyltransferase [Chlorobaculum parvum NCIB 8327]|uniref:UDP-3-O-acylglucosamine N-acyltransferase n=1 Tax=Chlorobaculum parvum (strain DSM 263 / NCIMB 8327) TaxID=517417 RepID=B3QMR0_CHLP8|nr:UDP-3-O-(3-hydroxymyristoyl)glucosamine N-acyltransferase [Chlorobaculum parvum]ACF11213.1 UDP-3-O-(3-hydroxymyristoyl) glucosamine N-acyltransferase [Chlorobaculum parvum NCIB 8327]